MSDLPPQMPLRPAQAAPSARARSARNNAVRGVGLLLAVVVLGALAYALVRWDLLGLSSRATLREALEQRGRVVVVGADDLLASPPQGTELLRVNAVKDLRAALDGADGQAVARALEAGQVHAIWVDPESHAVSPRSVHARLASYAHVAGLRGLYVSRRAALYAPDPFDALGAADREALAGVARGLLSGARSPRVASFPEALRRVQPVEVMVLLIERGKPRLWRSARGSSLARALVTAASVARQRWLEREQAMGGPLDRILPKLTIEVALLGDDGTLGERDGAFLDRAFGEEHGVGYEDKGAWRYLLPEPTRAKGGGRASVAYRALFAEDDLPVTTLDRKDLRLYRLFLSTLATSAPEAAPVDAVSPVRSPDELLAPPSSPSLPLHQPAPTQPAAPLRDTPSP